MNRLVSILRSSARSASLLVSISLGLTASGCGKSDQEGNAANGQVVARLGDTVITLPELETEYRLAQAPRNDENTRRILHELVVRKYYVQLALAEKLDREPSTHLEVLRAREQVLAMGHMQRRVAAQIQTASSTEISKIIGAHPASFAQRRLMKVEELAVPLGDGLKEVVEATKNSNSIAEVEKELTNLKLSFTRSAGQLDSAQLPEELLSQIEAKGKDQVFFIANGKAGVFFKITKEEPAPITGDNAAKLARQILSEQIYRASAQQAESAALASAKFEGEYAKLMQPPAAKAAPQAKPSGK